MKRFLHFWLAALILLVGLAVLLWQRETSRRLQHEIATGRVAGPDVQRMRAENERLRGALAEPEGAQAKQRAQTEIARLRMEIAFWEAHGKPSGNRAPMPVVSRAPDRAPEKDLTRIEDLKNAGQASPSAAFQTFVWALAKDDLSAWKPLLYLSPTGQKNLQEFWSGLPAESQARFKEPAQVFMMFWAAIILREDGFKVIAETPQASGDVHLRVRLVHGGAYGEQTIPLRPSPTGWQLVIPDNATENLSQSIAQASLYVAPPAKP